MKKKRVVLCLTIAICLGEVFGSAELRNVFGAEESIVEVTEENEDEFVEFNDGEPGEMVFSEDTSSLSSWDETDTTWQNDFQYHLSDGAIVLEKYIGNEKNVTLTYADIDGETYHPYLSGAVFKDCSSIERIQLGHDYYGEVVMEGDCSRMFCNCSNLKEIDFSGLHAGDITSTSEMFLECRNLESVDFSEARQLFGDATIDRSSMFEACSKLETVYYSEAWNSPMIVHDASRMFYNCYSLKYVGSKDGQQSFSPSYDDTADLSEMFAGCNGLETITVSGGGQNLSSMFEGCGNLKTLNFGINTSNTKNTSRMFKECEALTDLKMMWTEMDNVEDCSEMFYGCSSLRNLSLYKKYTAEEVREVFPDSGTPHGWCYFNPQNAKDMSFMFAFCKNLSSLDLGEDFCTGSAENMSGMFCGCASLKSLDLGDYFDTSNVVDMRYMFSGCSSLSNIDLKKLDTGKVEGIGGMFEDCKSLTVLDLSSFSLGKLFNYSENIGKEPWEHMLDGCTGLTQIKTPRIITQTAKIPLPYSMYEKNTDNTWKSTAYSDLVKAPSGTIIYRRDKVLSSQKITQFKPQSSSVVSGQIIKTTLSGIDLKGTKVYSSSNKKIATVSSNGRITAKAPGKVKISVYVKPLGDYEKSNTASFTISVKKPSKTSITKALARSSSIAVSWKKKTCSGYLIEYASDSKFKKGKKIIVVKGATRTNKQFRLKKKGTYFIRVFSYGSDKTIRSAASKVKKIVLR